MDQPVIDPGVPARHPDAHAEALALFESAASKKPDKVQPRLQVARTLRTMGRLDEARLQCESILETAPDCSPALLLLGAMAFDAGDWSGALGHFRAGAELKALNENAEDKVARCLFKLGRMEEAETFCRRALEENPNRGGMKLVLASVAEQRGDIAEAIEHLDSAAALKPGNPGAVLRLINLRKKAEWNAETEARCRELLETQPDFVPLPPIEESLPAPRNGSGPAKASEKGREIAGILEYLEGVAAAQPDNTELALRIVHLLRRTGRDDDAEARCRGILERQPAVPEAAHLLGLMLWKRGDLEAALEQFKSAAEQRPADFNFQLTHARILRSTNRIDEARSAFKRALEISPGSVPAILALASIARTKMDLDEALTLFQEAARLDPVNALIPLETAFVLSALHRAEEAERMMQVSEALARVNGNTLYAQRKFENFCQIEQWDNAAKCLAAYWPTLGDIPSEMVPSVTRYFVERRRWDDLLDFFRIRVVERGWSPRNGNNDVFDFVAIAARQTGRYAEILGLLDGWSGHTTKEGVQLREQLSEEVSLLQAVGAIDASAAVKSAAISDPLRQERIALRARVLNHGPDMRVVAISPPIALPEQGCHTIFFCTDADYLMPAVISLSSLLRHNNSRLPPCRLIVWCSSDVMSFASEVLGALGEHYGRKIEVLPSSSLFSSGLRFRTKFGAFTGRLLSEAAYYRIFAATQLSWGSNAGRALYIDSDTCCSSGIDSLFSMDMEGRPLAARRELPDWPGTVHCSKKLGLARGEYFNSGILLFDLSNPAVQEGLDRSVDAALQQQHLLTNLDQCALNLGFKDQVTTLDGGYNYAVRNDREEVLSDPPPAIVHFTAFPKPWDPRYRNPLCMRWFAEFEPLAEALPPELLKRLTASFIPQARTVHGIGTA